MSSNNEPRTTEQWIEHHLCEIAHSQAENSLLAEEAPDYLKVIALSLHTLATIEHTKLKAEPQFFNVPNSIKRMIEAVDGIIQGHERWGDV